MPQDSHSNGNFPQAIIIAAFLVAAAFIAFAPKDANKKSVPEDRLADQQATMDYGQNESSKSISDKPELLYPDQRLFNHPDRDVFMACGGDRQAIVEGFPARTTIEETGGAIFIRDALRFDSITDSYYETSTYALSGCRGFIGWAPESWFNDDGKLDAYFHNDESGKNYPFNIRITGQQRFGETEFAPFKVDFYSFSEPTETGWGTLVIKKKDPDLPYFAPHTIGLRVEIVI